MVGLRSRILKGTPPLVGGSQKNNYYYLIINKNKLNEHLLKHGIETRTIYYRNCNKIFNIEKSRAKNSERYENEILCLPNHKKITKEYIDYIIETISSYG
mgnify:CR=1 FL=1